MQSGCGPVSSVVTAVQEPHATVDVLVTVFDMRSSHTPALERLIVVVHPETTGLAATRREARARSAKRRDMMMSLDILSSLVLIRQGVMGEMLRFLETEDGWYKCGWKTER